MAYRGGLPLVTAETTDPKQYLGDILLRGTSARSIEGLKHPACAQALLLGQAGVWRDYATVQRGKQAMDGFQSAKAVEIEWNDRHAIGGQGRFEAKLGLLAVAERYPGIAFLPVKGVRQSFEFR